MQTRKTKTQTQSSADRLPTKTPKHSPSHSLAHEREKKKKVHLRPPECRHKSLPTQNLPKLLDQCHPLKAETQNKKEYDPKTWEKENSEEVGNKNEQTEKTEGRREKLTRPNKQRKQANYLKNNPE